MSNSGPLHRLGTLVSGVTSWEKTSGKAWSSVVPCPNCGGSQMLRIAAVTDGNYTPQSDLTQWLRCTTCLVGSVWNGAQVYPQPKLLREPEASPGDVASIWQEARLCLGAGAYSASALMCRKLLLHLAVEHGLAAKNSNGKAPTFMECVNQLETAGIATAKMRPWVERIKDVGNEATHELEPVGKDQAYDVAKFTLQLLVLAYELDAMIAGTDDA